MKKLRSAFYVAAVLAALGTSGAAISSDNLNATFDASTESIDLNGIQVHPTLSVKGGVVVTEAVRANGAILVNREGKRFVNEMANSDMAVDAMQALKGESVFLIFDDSVRRSINQVEEYIDLGIVSSGGSLEALGTSLGIDGKALGSTVAQYNRNVTKGIDFDFGRLDLRRTDLKATLKGKHFYAIEVTSDAPLIMGNTSTDTAVKL